MVMRLVSTRGEAPVTDFRGALLSGLADDGGLYTPDSWPQIDIRGLAGSSYAALAQTILAPLTGHAFAPADLAGMIGRAYAPFRHAATAPLVQIADNLFVLELFHGPTLAFKDFAMRMLAEMLEAGLTAAGRQAAIVCATSGDTGSAAVDAFAGRSRISLHALYPDGRISPVQRRQMTTVQASNVAALAVDGSFDDCQAIVKGLFAHAAFREAVGLTAVNSINWARIAAQAIYIFHAALALGAPARAVSFAVPTGNFGDIYAAYAAKRVGLPVERLVIASNANDILPRTLATGSYSLRDVVATTSPSMDIQISSNFERLLFHASGQDSAWIRSAMGGLRQRGHFDLPGRVLESIRGDFDALASNDADAAAEIARVWRDSGYLIDPHTATATRAARRSLADNPSVPVVALATAHPAKFPDAVEAACGVRPALPPHLTDLLDRPERLTRLANSQGDVERFILRQNRLMSGAPAAKGL
jgi:threonine synthase